MKSFLAIVSLLAVVFIAGRLSHQLSAKAATLGAGTTDAPVCGDLNDDSSADISDASYLLSFLFLGGPEPLCTASAELIRELENELTAAQADAAEAIQALQNELTAARAEAAETIQGLEDQLAAEQAESIATIQGLEDQLAGLQTELAGCRAGNCPVPELLPDTGQRTCYDPAGEVIECTSEICRGQDGFHDTGCPPESRFADNGNRTVTDNCTGLMWQIGTAPGIRTWCGALEYCETLTVGGHDDWRMPSVRELQSLVDYGRTSPSIDPIFSSLTSIHWTSTPDTGMPVNAWVVSFSRGVVESHDRADNHVFVRAVRSSGPQE